MRQPAQAGSRRRAALVDDLLERLARLAYVATMQRVEGGCSQGVDIDACHLGASSSREIVAEQERR
jgi:hypothetical protein